MAHTPLLNRIEALGIDTCIASNHHRNAINTELCNLMHPAELATWHINPVFQYLDRVIAHEKYSQTEKAQLSKFLRRLKQRRERYPNLLSNKKTG